MKRVDPDGRFLRYRGPIAYADLPGEYAGAEAAVFASSCENMPNTLLEAMAAGLPIACSSRSVMPEVLGKAGVYFDPESATSIASALTTLILDVKLRKRYADAAYETAKGYSWSRCASATFGFIREVADNGTFPARKV